MIRSKPRERAKLINVLKETHSSIERLNKLLPELSLEEKKSLFEDNYSYYSIVRSTLFTNHNWNQYKTKTRLESDINLLYYLGWKLRIIGKTLPDAHRQVELIESFIMKTLYKYPRPEFSDVFLFGIDHVDMIIKKEKKDNIIDNKYIHYKLPPKK